MKQWAQVMRRWFLWLLGDEPLPGKGSRTMLAGTLVVLVLLVAGGIALRPSSAAAPIRHRGVRAAASPLPTLATTTTTTPADLLPSAATTVPKSGAAAARARARVRARRQGATVRTRKPAGTTRRRAGTTTTTTTGSSGVAAPSTHSPTGPPLAFSAPAPDPAASAATAANAQVDPPAAAPAAPASPQVAPVPPPAPLATNASTGVGASLVSWKARDRHLDTGFDVFVGTAPGREWPVPANGTVPVAGTSCLVTGLSAGQTYYFTVRAVGTHALSPISNEVSATPLGTYQPVGSLPGPVVGMAATPDGTGYWQVTGSGAISAHGAAVDYGTPDSVDLAAPIVEIVSSADGSGYWELAADGGVFAYGDAQYEGSAARLRINAPIVGLAPTTDGKGYWLVAADGGVFAFGDAHFLGSLAGPAVSSTQAPLTGLVALPLLSPGGTVGAPAPVAAAAPAVGIVG